MGGWSGAKILGLFSQSDMLRGLPVKIYFS